MNSPSSLDPHVGLISLVVAVIALAITVVYNQVQLNQSKEALNFNTFAVLTNNYFDTRNRYWNATVAVTEATADIEFRISLTERFLKDHLDAIELFCRLFEEKRLGSDGIRFVEDTIKRDIETFTSDRLRQQFHVLGMSADDIPKCDGP